MEIGGTGGRSVGADSFSTWAPGIFFGKGFGDLPNAVRFLKPFAITGQLGVAIPTSGSTRTVTIDVQTGERDIEVEQHPDVLEWGFALGCQPDLPAITGAGLALARATRSVDSAGGVRIGNSTEPDGEEGQTTGTINPGVIWADKYFQVGVEAVISINKRTGNNVGVIAQLHFFVDDLFPK